MIGKTTTKALAALILVAASLSSIPAHAATLGFTTGLKLWLAADQGVTTAGSTVTGWADQSGNSHDGSHATGAPQLVPAAINGLPAISFNGAGDYFSLTGGQVLSTDSFTVFAVATDTGSPSGGVREIYSNWDASNSWSSTFLGTAEGDDPARGARFTDGLDVGNALADPTTPFILWGVYTGGSSAEMFVNGAFAGSNPQNNLPADISNPNGQRDITTPSFIGQQGSFGGEYWQGLIAEVLVYDGALGASEQAQVYSYLQEKWVAIPEPATWLLFLPAFAASAWLRRR